MRFPGEMSDISKAIEIADKWGYGNVIQELKNAWSKKLQEDKQWPMDKQAADLAARHICVWCDVDSRTGKKVKWKI